jgi:hypothetical protein
MGTFGSKTELTLCMVDESCSLKKVVIYLDGQFLFSLYSPFANG